MKRVSVFLYYVTDIGGGQWSLACYLESNTSYARFLRIGDIVTDKNGETFQVDTWDTYPSNFVSSGTITVSQTPETTVAPVDSVGYDSYVESINEVGSMEKPEVTDITVSSSEILSDNPYRYSINIVMADSGMSSLFEDGGQIMDERKNVYKIVDYVDNTSPVIVEDIYEYERGPSLGDAYIYTVWEEFPALLAGRDLGSLVNQDINDINTVKLVERLKGLYKEFDFIYTSTGSEIPVSGEDYVSLPIVSSDSSPINLESKQIDLSLGSLDFLKKGSVFINGVEYQPEKFNDTSFTDPTYELVTTELENGEKYINAIRVNKEVFTEAGNQLHIKSYLKVIDYKEGAIEY